MKICTLKSLDTQKTSDEWLCELDSYQIKAKAKYRNLFGEKWFSRLYPSYQHDDTGLFGFYSNEALTSGILICRDIKNSRRAQNGQADDVVSNTSKSYAWFRDIESTGEYIFNNFDRDNMHFYELIGGTSSYQHPYFDMDIPSMMKDDGRIITFDDAEKIVEETKSAIKAGFIEIGFADISEINHLDIRVYHTEYPIDDTTGRPKKYSYHIVIGNIIFNNSEEMMKLGIAVMNYCKSTYHRCFVDKIWHKTRQFRLYGSGKLNIGADGKFQPTIPKLSQNSIDEAFFSIWKQEKSNRINKVNVNSTSILEKFQMKNAGNIQMKKIFMDEFTKSVVSVIKTRPF